MLKINKKRGFFKKIKRNIRFVNTGKVLDGGEGLALEVDNAVDQGVEGLGEVVSV